MREVRSAAVLGLGLIGGSLARDLSARGVRVAGFDRDPATVRSALRSGEVHAALGPHLEGVEAAEVVVLAVPVRAAPELLARAAPRLDGARLVTDAGSTKGPIVSAASALGLGDRFVGAHPLAGDHRSGWAASRTGLFAGARVFLCPAPEVRDGALSLARELWCSLGGLPEVLDARAHDRRLAWTSHLPQAASTALALALAGRGIPRAELGPGGRDATRLAGSSPEMWTDVALENADSLEEALSVLEDRIAGVRAALAAGDRQALHRFFAAGREWTAPDGA